MTEQQPYVHVEQVKKNVFRVNLREWQGLGRGGLGEYSTTVTFIARSTQQANRLGKRALKRAKERTALELKSWEIR